MYELYDNSGDISEIADDKEFLKSLFTLTGVAGVGVDFVGDGVPRSSLKQVAASKRLYLCRETVDDNFMAKEMK